MILPKAIEQRFHERVTSRALADTLAQFPPERTISAQMLAAAQITPTLVHERTLADGAPMATMNLPRITLDHRVRSGQTAQESTNVADFEVVGVLGEGGMGRVLLARQHSLARDVAIKMTKESDTSDLAAPWET